MTDQIIKSVSPSGEYTTFDVRKDAEMLELTTGQERNSFQTMSTLRNNKPGQEGYVRPEQMWDNINSPQGHTLANVGISAALEFIVNKKKYFGGVVQQRGEDFGGDSPIKLLSGYVTADQTLHEAIIKELHEELLVKVGTGYASMSSENILAQTGEIDHGYAFDELPQAETYFNVLVSESDMGYLPSLDPRLLRADQHVDPSARLMFHHPTNSAQYTLPVAVELPDSATLHHSEDAFNPKEGKLETKLKTKGFVLLGLTANDTLSGDCYHLVDGELKPILQLGEAFATPTHERLVTANNTTFGNYLPH